MLTSVGFGYVCPTTRNGRLFAVIYCLIGIPLTLVTIANLAKFISETAFRIHYRALATWIRFKNRKKLERGEERGQHIFNDDMNEQELLDKVRLVRFPSIVVFIFAILYGFSASFIIYQRERWTYLETLYFTFISILTVGFGDFRPSSDNLLMVLLIVLGGITVSTMW